MNATLSHDAVKPSGSVVSPVVNRLATSGPSDVPAFDIGSEVPSHYRNAKPVKLIGRVVNISQVAKSVVHSLVIDVVNHIRLLIVSKEPADSMSLVSGALVLQPKIAVSSSVASGSTFGFTGNVSQKPRVGIISNVIANRIWNNLSSHFVLPHNLVRGLAVVAVSTPILLSGCATAKGNQRQAEHNASQVRMIAVQREAMEKEALLESQERAALYQAISNVAATNPEHSPAALVALAVIGVGGQQDGPDAPLMSLQRQENVGLEYVKALAPTVGGLITGVGIAAINAETQRNASDNNRDILLGDQAADRGIVEAVAGLGGIAAAQTGVSVGGDYLQVSDNASIDQSTTTDSSENETTSVEGDFNTGSQITSSSNPMNSNNTSVMNGDAPATYLGTTGTVQELVDYLANLGQPYSLTLNGAVVASSTTGTGSTVTIDCNSVQFSPRPAQCS